MIEMLSKTATVKWKDLTSWDRMTVMGKHNHLDSDYLKKCTFEVFRNRIAVYNIDGKEIKSAS